MERITRFRAQLLLGIFALVLVFFGFRLYKLQVIEYDGVANNVTTYTTITRVKAARGDILDTNGNMLVSNRASYDLIINHYVLLTAKGTNDHLYRLVNRCAEGDIAFSDNLPISREKPFVYTLDSYNSTWQNYFQVYLADKELDSDITAPQLIKRLREATRSPPPGRRRMPARSSVCAMRWTCAVSSAAFPIMFSSATSATRPLAPSWS